MLGALSSSIRNFAKSVENELASAMEGIAEDLILVKLSCLSAFTHMLRRRTSLNHLAQAAREVLINETQVNQMYNDLNKVDFGSVRDQVRKINYV